MADRNTRLACFDDLGTRLFGEEQAIQEPAPESVAEPEATSLPEDLGGPAFDKTKGKQYRGVITSCRESHDGRLFFFFDNGQVWQQVKFDKLRFKNCNFNVTVLKDAFGYKMQIDGQEKRIRISRKR